MTEAFHAPGLTADWLNAWLAAIGITALLPEVTLRWTDDPLPVAVFDAAEETPLAERIWVAIPDEAQLRMLAITRTLEGYPEFPRKVDANAFHARAVLARATRDFSLAASVTDLKAEFKPEEGLPHAPFDPPAPKGVTLWERVVSCRKALDEAGSASVEETLVGQARRVPINGLGFDAHRLVAGVQPASMSVDPVVESLAFYGLSLFPMRGDGRDVRQRGWMRGSKGKKSFVWPVWKNPLDRWAIDALIDQIPLSLGDRGIAARWGITDWFRSVAYEPKGSLDSKRAYFSQRFSSDDES